MYPYIIDVIKAALSGGFFAFIVFLLKRHDIKKEKELDPQKVQKVLDACLAMIQYDIVASAKEHISTGYISHTDYDDLYEVASLYFKAGGNHRAKTYWDEIERLDKR